MARTWVIFNFRFHYYYYLVFNVHIWQAFQSSNGNSYMDDLWSALSFRKQSGELIIVAEKQMEPNLSEKYVMA